MRAKAPVFDVRHAIEWPDGRRIMLSVSGAPMVDAEGRIDRIIFMIEDVTQQVEYERALSWAVDVNAALAELARTLLASSSLEDISALVLEQAKRLTNSRWGYVGYVDLQTGHLICPTMTTDVWEVCQVPDKDIVFETFTGLWGWVLRNKESLLTNAPAEDSRSTGTPPGHVPIERFLSAPALIGEELVGQVALANADRDYGERELELVERLAALYALAIQRQRTESALRRSEHKYRNLFEHANDSIFIVDPETLRFLEVNEKAAQRLGYRREELLAMTVDAISAPGRETSIDGLVDALKKQGSIVFEHVHRRKDGSEMPVEISSRLVDYENRTVIQSLVRDITERKQAEKAREREIEALQLLTGAPRAGVTAEMFGLLPLNKGLPDVFSELVARYGELLDLALEERVYKVSHDVSEQLRPLAERLGFLRAGPRDVVEIHLTALRKKSQDVPAQKAQAYAEEGRMMVLELMGHLTAYYRNSGGVLTEVAASHSQEGGRDGE
jgi:PAS domain S-box-containing protein